MNLQFMDKEKLAFKIAEALGDLDSLALHRKFVDQYAESHLRKILLKVLSIPPESIRKTRGALFTHLVQQHTRKQNNSLHGDEADYLHMANGAARHADKATIKSTNICGILAKNTLMHPKACQIAPMFLNNNGHLHAECGVIMEIQRNDKVARKQGRGNLAPSQRPGKAG